MKAITIATVVLGAIMTQPAVASQAYPNKTVRIIVPYQAGQGTDVATRLIAEQLGQALGQGIVVENRPGAGGNIGTSEAARAAPDGYTLLMGTNGTHVLNKYLYKSTPFDPEKDFAPVMLISTFPMVVLANPESKFDNLGQVIAQAKAKPDTLNVAMPSTTAQLVLEMLDSSGVTGLRGIPYKGSSTSMSDTIGGQVPLAIDTVSASRPFIDSGRLKALGVTSREPTPLLPSVPTVASQGVDNFQVLAWNAVYVPAGTPETIIQRLNTELATILAKPEIRQRLLDLGHDPQGGSPERLAQFASAERKIWEPVIAASGLRIE